MKPYVVTDTIFPPSFGMLCKHSPITLLIKAIVQEARMGLEIEVAVTLINLLLLMSKLFLFEIPLTTFP
jgi:hypothetical protein